MAEASARMPLDILLRRDLGLALQQDAQGLQHESLGQNGGAGRAVERAALGVRMGQQMDLALLREPRGSVAAHADDGAAVVLHGADRRLHLGGLAAVGDEDDDIARHELAAGAVHSLGAVQETVLPQEIITAVEDCGFFESIPLWAVTLIGGLFITVLSFVMIMTVYGRFCKLYLYSAIAPIPLSSFAGEPSQNVGRSFLKSYAAVCLEGAIIVLACVIFSHFAASSPTVKTDTAAVTMVWSYIAELIFNMLILVGSVKMADRIVREMMGL